MPRMILTAFDTREPVVVVFDRDAEVEVTNGPEGATRLTVQERGAEHAVYVEETETQIDRMRRIALDI